MHPTRMKVEVIAVGPFAMNAMIVYSEETRRGFLIDPGDEVDRILTRVEELGVQIDAIVFTHGHIDHVAYAEEAIKRAGIQVKKRSIRGGTDGSRLSFMGLPCPNIFAGEHAFHSKEEWVSVQDMQKSVETIINLCIIWEEKS